MLMLMIFASSLFCIGFTRENEIQLLRIRDFLPILGMSVLIVGWKWSNANESWKIYIANLLNLLPSNKKYLERGKVT